MKKTEKNLYLLYMLFGVSLVTANAIASKVFDTGIMLFGSSITLTVGVIVYPLTFLITDIIGELWGKAEANLAVRYGLICQVVATLFIIIARYLTAVDETMQASYVQLMGQNWVFVVASLTGYWCSQSWDVYIFHKVRENIIAKHGNNKQRWIWNNASTMTSQFIDSVLYVVIAFGFGFGWLFNSEMTIPMINMIIGQYLIKVVFAAFDTPFFYFFTRKVSNNVEE